MDNRMQKRIYETLKEFGFDNVYAIWHVRQNDDIEIEGMVRSDKGKTYKFNLKMDKKMNFKSIIFIKTKFDFYFRGGPIP